MRRAVGPTSLHSLHGSKTFLNLMLLGVLSKDGFMKSAILVVVFVYHLLFRSL